MKKEKVLYICGNNHIPLLECSEWYEVFKSSFADAENVNLEKYIIETLYAIIHFVYKRPLFTWKYDFILNADRKDDDVKLFAIGIGKNY